MKISQFHFSNLFLGSGKRFITGDDDNVILYERGGLLNRYKPRPLSDGTDGPIKNIKWRGRFAAWTSKRGVVVHDVVQGYQKFNRFNLNQAFSVQSTFSPRLTLHLVKVYNLGHILPTLQSQRTSSVFTPARPLSISAQRCVLPVSFPVDVLLPQ